MASITDKFNKVGNNSGLYPVVATVTASRTVGDTILSCNSLSGWATETPVHFATYALTADGVPDKTTQTDWKGIVIDNTITNLTRIAGRDDSGNVSGEKVEILPTVGWANDLVDGILVSHNQNGSIKDGSITSASLSSGAVTTDKIASLSVTNDKIADGTISGLKLQNATVGTNKLTNSAVCTDNINDGAVTSAKISANVIKMSNNDIGAGANLSSEIILYAYYV